ncbi:DUF2785 domain-containing protein [Lysinibacillus fusiformis]|uniref:DUF2785 domain-containing protein n=1 Tax=Lysinibacillus fusiformis TaxID=28031 RepID=UPI000D3847E6|nr:MULTISPECIES: DUF2785 domain-containing protein [Lysinibacillus]MED4672184.1 DUF2785 domain-containing protein [Lysinibacillus fusiformis]QAS56151.1 hypothetical protein LSP_07030 [Lysinibacillus sphaericus]RDV34738.1 hypothetical protein C7B90_04270 [Lysinibacillus fusiformis]GED65279.1 membrane protein [Lysinibacillus fusiformis]
MIQNILIAGDLKDKLSAIKQGQTAWEQVNQEQLLQSMLAHIGSTDSELRDTYIYSSFYEWILEKNLLDHRCLTKLWHYCLDHLLLNGIEEEESDGVFTRSFTTLLVALILARDLKDNFLSQDSIEEGQTKLLAYVKAEMDVRGFVPGKGWAHSVAHVSDAMDELVKNPKIKKTAYDDMLHAIWSMYLQPHYIFIHDEDERLLVPIFAMLERGLAQNEVVQLIQQMPATLSTLKDQLDEANFYIVRFNCKTLLKSFFIQTNHQAQYASLHQSIVTCLNEIN